MIVLGIDPGTARTGFGVVVLDRRSLRAVAHGVIATGSGEDAAARLAAIFEGVRALVVAHRPDSVALESLFIGVNPRTILSVGQARGAALAACGLTGVPSAEYTPSQVKATVCGYGRADKWQVAAMVRQILALDEAPASDHASDALGVAVCHHWSTPAPSVARLGAL